MIDRPKEVEVAICVSDKTDFEEITATKAKYIAVVMYVSVY